MWGLKKELFFLHANTITEARKVFYENPDVSAIVVDAHMNGIFNNDYRAPFREWGFDTDILIAEFSSKFQGPIIAAPCQWWHFKPMRDVGCSHSVWKWGVARLLRKLLL